MAGYRRFIAYVYEYPQGKKGEGRGFIKVESREGVCRMHYKLTGIYGRQSAPAKVYGYVRKERGCVGVLLGSCDLAGSSVQFELETEDENMGGSGYQLGDLCGLVLLTEAGEMYGSGWDDKQVNLSEIRLPAEKRKIVEYPTEIKAAETGRAEIERTETGRRKIEAAESETAKAGRAKKEAAELERAETERTETGRRKIGAAESETAKAGRVKKEAAELGRAEPEAGETERAKSETAEPETQTAECTLPEMLGTEEEELDFRELKLPKADMERDKKAAENMNRERTGEVSERREERREFPKGREEERVFPERREERREFPEGREEEWEFPEGREERREFPGGREERREFPGGREERREFSEGREEGRVFPEGREEGREFPEGREERREFPEGREEVRIFPGESEGKRSFSERREEGRAFPERREKPENSCRETGNSRNAGTDKNEKSGTGKEAAAYRGAWEDEEAQRHEIKEKEDWEQGTQNRNNWIGTDREEKRTDAELRDADQKYGEVRKPEQEELRGQSAPAAQRAFMPFSDNSISECRKISPADFRLLQGRDRGLVKNSFLRHGFSQYGHLLTGRREEDGRYILGVPGVYERQEALMAGMYGFPYFKETGGARSHSRRFGYWYRLIDTPDSDRWNGN